MLGAFEFGFNCNSFLIHYVVDELNTPSRYFALCRSGHSESRRGQVQHRKLCFRNLTYILNDCLAVVSFVHIVARAGGSETLSAEVFRSPGLRSKTVFNEHLCTSNTIIGPCVGAMCLSFCLCLDLTIVFSVKVFSRSRNGF